MCEKTIDRRAASFVLNTIAGNAMLRDDLCDSLREIAGCIDAETDGYDVWDADKKDFHDLYNYNRDAKPTKEEITKREILRSKYKFTPRREVIRTRTMFKELKNGSDMLMCERCGNRFTKEEAASLEQCPYCHAEVIVKTLGQKIIENVPSIGTIEAENNGKQ